MTTLSKGPSEFGLFVDQRIIWLCFKFGTMPWSDQPFNVHLVPQDIRATPPDLTGEQRALLNVLLVEAETGIVKAIRAVTFAQIFGSTISSSGDDAIKTNGFAKSKLTSRNGALSTDIASILESTVAIDRVKGDFSIAEIRGSRLKFGDGNVFLNSNWIMDSEIELGKGDLTMNAVGLMKSSISNAGSSGKITLSVRHNEDSKITKGETSGFERGYSKYASGKKTLWTQTPEGAPHRVDLDGMLMNNALDQPTV